MSKRIGVLLQAWTRLQRRTRVVENSRGLLIASFEQGAEPFPTINERLNWILSGNQLGRGKEERKR